MNYIIKLESGKYYTKVPEEDQYQLDQINRHTSKRYKMRNKEYYKNIANDISEIYQTNKFRMLCLGSRNNWERSCLRDFTGNMEVYSNDIAPNSNADFIGDFNTIKTAEKFDIIFSNSIDHTYDATASYLAWLECIKQGGLLIIDFDTEFKTGNETATDCCTFTAEGVDAFLDFLQSKNVISIEKKYFDGYYRTVVKKI